MTANYSLALGAASVLLALDLTESERDAKRRRKKERVTAEKRRLLKEAFPKEVGSLKPGDGYEKLLAGDWPRPTALTLGIDLMFSNPFAPYELRVSDADMDKALVTVVRHIGLSEADVKRLRATQMAAFRAHSTVNYGQAFLIGAGGLIVMALGGWLLAPAIGGAIGAAAGLSGAAATAHGLAILGGGSLAIGGAGMAGGMWVVTGAGAAIGLAATSGSTLLLQLGADAARQELIKLQVNYKEVLIGTQIELAKSQSVIQSLTRQQRELEAQLKLERDLNDANAARVKQIEATLKAVEKSLKWMRAQKPDGGSTSAPAVK